MRRKRSGLLTWFGLVLWLSSVSSAMAVVYSTYQSRQATQELENLRREASGLRVISGQYMLEKSSWAAYSRVEQLATNELDMDVPKPKDVVLVYKK